MPDQDENLFNNQEELDQFKIEEGKNYFEELVGEGKKYKDPEALARSNIYANAHIRNLEHRMDTIGEDYRRLLDESKNRPRLEELINKLVSDRNDDASSRNEPASNEDNNNRPDPELFRSFVSEEVQRIATTQKEKENYDMVLSKVRERYGSHYRDVLKDRGQELGLAEADINQMARRSPNLFFKTFDVETKPAGDMFQTPPTSQTRQSSFAPNTVKRTQSYYDKLNKEKPGIYLDRKIAIQMDKDAQELGAAFFDM